MTDNVVQIRDYQSKKDIERMQRELEKEAKAILAEAVPGQFTAPEQDPA